MGADVLHVLNSAVINLVSKFLQDQLVAIIKDAVEVPVNQVLSQIEHPLPLGFGSEKFQLDNSLLSVDYTNHVLFTNKGEFQSTKQPVESELVPATVAAPGKRDVIISFSDYVLNTLLESMYAENIGSGEVVLPIIKTMFDKECPKCALVVRMTALAERPCQVLSNGKATVELTGATIELGALQVPNTVLPLVTLSINASAAVAFTFEDTDTGASLNAALSLDKLDQRVLISHIGDLDLSILSRNVQAVITTLLDLLNQDVPALPLPGLAGVQMTNTEIIIDNRELRIEADLKASNSVVVV